MTETDRIGGDTRHDGDGIGADQVLDCTWMRHGLIAFGWTMVATGVLGLVLPVLPTTVFLLLALWAFSKSSRRFHLWLYTHPRLGRLLREWHAHRVIPARAKIMALGMMSVSLIYVTVFWVQSWVLPATLALLFAGVSGFILSRPSRIAA